MTPEEEAKKDEEAKRAQEAATAEMNQILFQDPKKFVNSTRIYAAENFFGLRLNIGNIPENFAIPPRIAKVLAHFLVQQVKIYEDAFGQIPLDLSVPSPLSVSDVQKPDERQTPPSEPDKPSGKPKKKK